MRTVLHHELVQELVAIGALTGDAMELATRALVEVDPGLAAQVLAIDDEVDARSRHCDRRACELLALQAPMAGDLRAVVTAIKAASKIERMSDLARHVAELVLMRHPVSVLPAELVPSFTVMARLAVEAARCLQCALEERNGACLNQQENVDDEVDRLYRTVLDDLRHAEPGYPTQTTVDATLLARYLERFADQAVAVARQLDYAVTGVVGA